MSAVMLKFPQPRQGEFDLGQKPSKQKAKKDFVADARAAWGDDAPDWVMMLAAEAERTTATDAARRIGYSGAVVSGVLANKYSGDLGAVAEKVRGALMGVTVECPILGEIRRDHCLREQSLKHRGTSPSRTALYHACRGGCPNSRLKGGGDANG